MEQRGQTTEHALRAVLEVTSAATGKDFFRSLVRHLASALQARHAFVAECAGSGNTRARTLAFWSGDDFGENFEYSVEGTPCELVTRHNQVCFYPADVRAAFPDDRHLVDLDAESYVGFPVLGSSNEVIGHLAALDVDPMPEHLREKWVLKIFAARAGAEIERIHAEQKQRESEQALRASEDRYRVFYEDNPSMYFTVDEHGTVLSVNKFGAQQLGYEIDELIGHPVLGVFVEDDKETVQGQLRECLRNPNRVGTWELRKVQKNGEVLWVRESARAVSDADGKPIVLIVCENITEQKLAEERHKALEAQIQHSQKLESLGVLAGGIAHDFNNLLTGVLGNASLAEMELPPGSAARQYLGLIEKAAQHAASLCRQMLAYSGKGRLASEPLCLSTLVSEITHMLQVSISKEAVLRLELADDLPSVEADSTQIQQIIMNLITNASDAVGEEGGMIVVRTGITDCDREYLGGTYLDEDLDEGRYVHVEVADTGSGMDEDTLERIFDPFFSTKFTGRGLGLAAAIGIVRSHRGAIKVESEPGRGTTIKVLFPASDLSLDDSTRRAASTVEIRGWRGRGTVLVVDDKETVRSVAKRSLEQCGFDVLTAEDGSRAIEIFSERPDEIEAVLLDLTMPGLSGKEAFHALRRIRADLPVVLSSGYNEENAVGSFAEEHLTDFIQKPYKPAELIEKFRDALTR